VTTGKQGSWRNCTIGRTSGGNSLNECFVFHTWRIWHIDPGRLPRCFNGARRGVVIVPVLCVLFKIDIHYAIGASLVSVIATSSELQQLMSARLLEYSHRNVLGSCHYACALLGAYLTAKVSGIGSE